MTDYPQEPDEEPVLILPPRFLRHPVHLLAFGFGSGAVPRAPGTWGSLAAIPLWYPISLLPELAYWLVVLVAFVVGIWLCGQTARALKVHDHGGIVWDEFVGMWIVLGFFPETYYGVLLCFVAFRLFDVWKPWPIDWIDERTPGGLGIMIDDVLAAVMALGVIWAAELWLMPGLL
ncbi:phosphatidylglycerophosphatase A [Marinobacter sp. M1N3S26]|uniref:phosphatidylglycerophosphatase A family protein n=1 Tax=unclassified Marinobacter TaxID=83889 RepID=UPI00387B400C